MNKIKLVGVLVSFFSAVNFSFVSASPNIDKNISKRSISPLKNNVSNNTKSPESQPNLSKSNALKNIIDSLHILKSISDFQENKKSTSSGNCKYFFINFLDPVKEEECEDIEESSNSKQKKEKNIEKKVKSYEEELKENEEKFKAYLFKCLLYTHMKIISEKELKESSFSNSLNSVLEIPMDRGVDYAIMQRLYRRFHGASLYDYMRNVRFFLFEELKSDSIKDFWTYNINLIFEYVKKKIIEKIKAEDNETISGKKLENICVSQLTEEEKKEQEKQAKEKKAVEYFKDLKELFFENFKNLIQKDINDSEIYSNMELKGIFKNLNDNIKYIEEALKSIDVKEYKKNIKRINLEINSNDVEYKNKVIDDSFEYFKFKPYIGAFAKEIYDIYKNVFFVDVERKIKCEYMNLDKDQINYQNYFFHRFFKFFFSRYLEDNADLFKENEDDVAYINVNSLEGMEDLKNKEDYDRFLILHSREKYKKEKIFKDKNEDILSFTKKVEDITKKETETIKRDIYKVITLACAYVILLQENAVLRKIDKDMKERKSFLEELENLDSFLNSVEKEKTNKLNTNKKCYDFSEWEMNERTFTVFDNLNFRCEVGDHLNPSYIADVVKRNYSIDNENKINIDKSDINSDENKNSDVTSLFFMVYNKNLDPRFGYRKEDIGFCEKQFTGKEIEKFKEKWQKDVYDNFQERVFLYFIYLYLKEYLDKYLSETKVEFKESDGIKKISLKDYGVTYKISLKKGIFCFCLCVDIRFPEIKDKIKNSFKAYIEDKMNTIKEEDICKDIFDMFDNLNKSTIDEAYTNDARNALELKKKQASNKKDASEKVKTCVETLLEEYKKNLFSKSLEEYKEILTSKLLEEYKKNLTSKSLEEYKKNLIFNPFLEIFFLYVKEKFCMLEEYAIDREWFKDFILKDSYEFLKRNGIKDYDEDFAQKKAEYLKREGFLNILPEDEEEDEEEDEDEDEEMEKAKTKKDISDFVNGIKNNFKVMNLKPY